MTAERRLARIEEALSPTQLVLRWLAEAHAYGDIDSYVASLLDQEPPVPPLDSLAREAARGARSATRGKRADLIDAAVRSALRETVFRFELVMRINVTAHELLDREALIDAALSAHVALLVCEDSQERQIDPGYPSRFATLRDLLGFRSASYTLRARLAPSSKPAISTATRHSSRTLRQPGRLRSRTRRRSPTRLPTWPSSLAFQPLWLPTPRQPRLGPWSLWRISWSRPGPRPCRSSARANGPTASPTSGCGLRSPRSRPHRSNWEPLA